MKQAISIILLFWTTLCAAQGPVDNPGTLPSIIPPSPDVASLVKIGSMNTNLHTGSASVSIPLYELSVGSLHIPVSLAYSTNGTRTNEIASRVGLSWNLVAGGSISRVVHDEEDGGSLTIPHPAPDFQQPPDQALLDYMLYANLEHYDTERDEYSFSVNGMSGKFYFDDNGVIRLVDHSNIKIIHQNNTFTLTDGNGTIYEFGFNNVIEKTKDVKTNGNLRAHKIKTTAWFLTRIISLEGHTIEFNYTAIETKTNLGPYQSVILKTLQPNYPSGGFFDLYPQDCKPLCSGQWSAAQINKIDYDTYYLSNISASNGQQVYFVYQDRPDASGDNRLVGLNVYTTNDASSAKLIKKYELEYDDYTVGTDLNQRFFLKKLYTYSTGNEIPQEVLVHNFEYNDWTTLGSQGSLLQDYYGYSKGNGPQPDNFFPLPNDYASYEFGNLGADRSPSFEHTKAGTLKKVIYPTGGYEEFVYEPHTLVEYNSDSVFTSNLDMTGVGLNFNSINTYTDQFTVTSAPVRISHTTEWNSSGPAPGSPNYWTPDDIHFLSYLEIWKVSTNQKIFESRHKNYLGDDYFPHLETGVLYEVRLKVVGNSHRSNVLIHYDPTVQVIPFNKDACGLRVQKIDAFDPVSNQTTSKYFTYASLQNTSLTTGIGLYRPSFEAFYAGGGVCIDMVPPYYVGENLAECPQGMLQVTSSSLSGGYTFNGSPVAYTHVMESDDPLFANGGVEHHYYTYHNPQQPLIIRGTEIAGASSAGAFPDKNGMELETKWFKKDGSNFIILRKVQNEYSADPGVGHTLTNYVTRKRWDPPSQPNFSYTDKVLGFDVSGYIYMTNWLHLDQTTTTEYDEAGLNPVTKIVEYEYGNIAHTMPTIVRTWNSKENEVRQEMKYPADYTTAPYTTMISKNIHSPVIESKSFNEQDLLSTVYTGYEMWSGGHYKPDLVKMAKGTGSLEDRLQYYNYDDRGNLLEVSKEDGMHYVYLWNYQKTYPVAEVKNAILSDIAYTSFEGDALGNWVIPPGVITQAKGITGKKYFTGSISKAVDDQKSYYVTLWTKEYATVNDELGTLLQTKGQWSLYKWIINGATEVEVKGTDMDEVRLYPVGAQMTTYTYEPFIGMSDACDANNKIVYYEYDGLNRLLLVRDIDNNILKQYEYKYNQVIAPCANTAPDWQETGLLQCVMIQNNNYTGEQKKQERDLNNCSTTYLQTRWVSLGVTGLCEPIPGCTGNDKRVVNGACEQGVKVLVSSVLIGSTWHCTYKYVWSDGFEGNEFTETGSIQCPIPLD